MSDDKDALIYLANVRIDELDAENAKLREELEKWNRLAENIELPEYPVTEFHPKDLERENAKLRELAVLNWEWAHSCCGDGCKLRTDGCGYGIDRECNYEREVYDRMRELGVEV